MQSRNFDSVLPPRMAVAGSLMERVLHDLKQPLNLIRVVAQDVYLDARKDRLDLADLPESMREIERAVDEAVTRIERIRLFTKTSVAAEETAVASISAACGVAVDRVRRSSPAAEVMLDVAEELPDARVNQVFLEHALWELLDNALWATAEVPDRPQRVSVSAAPAGDEVVLRVRDHGPGVPEEIQARLFEPFVSTRERCAGLGLALATVLVGEFGGRVALAHTGDDGSVFEIVVPVRS